MLLRSVLALVFSVFLHFLFLQFFQNRTDEDIPVTYAQSISIAIRRESVESRLRSVSVEKKLERVSVRKPSRSAFAEATADKLVIAKNSDSGEEDNSPHVYSISETQETFLQSYGKPPSYPRRAQMLQQEGTVLVRIDVKEGILHKTEIIESSGHALLDESALNAIRRWQFRHLTLSFLQKITFQLNSI